MKNRQLLRFLSRKSKRNFKKMWCTPHLFCIIKKVCKTESGIPLHGCRPFQGGVPHCAFFEAYGNISPDIPYAIKKVCKTEPGIPLHGCRPFQGGAPHCAFFEAYGNISPDIPYAIKKVCKTEPGIPLHGCRLLSGRRSARHLYQHEGEYKCLHPIR